MWSSRLFRRQSQHSVSSVPASPASDDDRPASASSSTQALQTSPSPTARTAASRWSWKPSGGLMAATSARTKAHENHHSRTSSSGQATAASRHARTASQPAPVAAAEFESTAQAQPPIPHSNLSRYSSPLLPESLFYSSDFMLGAGMVILQPATGRIVVVHETARGYWFLPKGRKDVGESLADAAVREAYEESGFRARLLPLWQDHNAPAPPGSVHAATWARSTEPIALQLTPWRSRRKPTVGRGGGEYLVSWFVGQIPADAVAEKNTGMPDEANYAAHLLSYEDALRVLTDYPSHRAVVEMAWMLWLRTQQYHEELRKRKMNDGWEDVEDGSAGGGVGEEGA